MILMTVFVTGYVEPHYAPRPKRRKLILSDQERSNIENDKMLTNESTHADQHLLHEQFQDYAGFEDTVLGSI